VSGKLSVCFIIDIKVVLSLDPTIAMLHQVVSDMNKRKHQLLPNVGIATRNHGDCVAGDNLQQDICRWLSPPDPWKNHHVARESHHTGTAAWFLHGNMFSEWKSSPPSSLLWVHGKRGFPLGAYHLRRLIVLPFCSGLRKECTLVR